MAITRAYLIDLKYSKEQNITVYLFCRTEEGKMICLKDYFRPNFFVLPRSNQDLTQLRAKISRMRFDENNFVTATSVEKKIINCKEEGFIKIYVSRPETVAMVKNVIEKWDSIVNCYENDISLTRKYILEHKIVPFSLFEAEVVELNDREAGFATYQVVKYHKRGIAFVKPKVLSMSVFYEEASPGNKALAAVSCSSDTINRVITWKELENPSSDIKLVKSEEELLLNLRELIQNFKPDIVLFEDKTYGLSNIMERAEKYRIRFNVNLDYSEPFVSHTTSRIRTVGINEIYLTRIIDNFINLSLVEENLQKIYTTLQNVASFPSITTQNENNQIIDIINKKSRINYQIFDSLFDNLTEIFKLLGLRIADLLNFSLRTIIEWILIKESIDNNHIVLNKPRMEEDDKREPALNKYLPVIDPVPGIYSNIAHVDLKAMYPDIIISKNLSPDTINCECCEVVCTKNTGILPAVLNDIISRIKRINSVLKKEENDNLKRRKSILKRILNYFYEYLSIPSSRWFCIELLQALNLEAKEEIGNIIRETNISNSVIYSDYKELFVSIKSRPEQKKAESKNAERRGAEQKNEEQSEQMDDSRSNKDRSGDDRSSKNNSSNKSSSIIAEEYAQIITSKYPLYSWFKVGEMFEKGLFLPRDDPKQAKKRFALLDKNNQVSSYNIVKYNQPGFVKQVIDILIVLILTEKSSPDILKYLRAKIKELEENKVSEQDLILKTKIVKEPEEYPEKSIQHSIISQLKEKKVVVKKGDYIEYVVLKGDESISKRVKLPPKQGEERARERESNENEQAVSENKASISYDSDYYVEKHLLPAIEDLLFIKGMTIEEIVLAKDQKSLDKFIVK